MRKPPRPTPGRRPESEQRAPSEIQTIPAAISTARASGRSPMDAPPRQVVASEERFAERSRLRRRLLLRKVLIWAGLAGGVLLGVWAVFSSSFFSLRADQIEVVGAGEFVSASEVEEVLSSEVGRPLVRLDLDDIGDRVTQVRGVSSAIVRRDWPNGLRVSLSQRVPVAAVEWEGKYVLLDSDGVRVGESAEPPADLALAQVPLDRDRESSLAAVLTVLDEIPVELREEIIDIGADTRDTVFFTLDEGVRVEWGSSDDSALKASVLSVLRQQKAQIYDVSAPTLPVTRDK